MLFFFFRAPIAPTRSLHRKPLTFACHCALLHVNRNPQRKCGRPSPTQTRQHAHNTQIVFSIISTIYNTYRVLYFAIYRFLPTKTHLTVAITRQNKKSVHDLCLLTLTPETEANRRKRRAEKFCTTQREDFFFGADRCRRRQKEKCAELAHSENSPETRKSHDAV